ncbi:MAG: hypothetical protein BGO43_10070 [Gammaproteobacteria bacterium 39-13]|nr:phosphodiester glycosidase family protein [Gammaproteobacteria bacterium]OJV89103.1 MAG: hypothetical protein BGO43_10070 [Gammaproteobacteria bacterium 39-13]
MEALFSKKGFFLACLIGIVVPCSFAKTNANLPYQFIEKNGHQIHILEIDPHEYKIVSVQADPKRETVSAMVKKHAAIAGINGGFFHIDDNGQGKPAGALKIDGRWVGFPLLPRGAIGWDKQGEKPLVDRILTKTERTRKSTTTQVIPQVDKTRAAQKKWQAFPYIVGGIPLLMKNGKEVGNYQIEKTTKSFLNDRHARTAVCIKPNHHWLFLVASHTKEKDRAFTNKIMEGLTIRELTQVLQELGCKDAINLDGGGSSTLVMNEKTINPDAGDMDEIAHFYHERPVLDAILIFLRQP